jgi:hypothetical protein
MSGHEIDVLDRLSDIDPAGAGVPWDDRAACDLREILQGDRRSASRTRRVVRFGLPALALGALAAVFGILLVASPSRDTDAAGAAPFGLRATLQVVPPAFGRTDLPTATARAATLIRVGGEKAGVVGMKVRVLAPGRIEVELPYARAADQITALLPLDFRIWDVDSVTIAESPPNRPDALVSRIPSGRTAGYLLSLPQSLLTFKGLTRRELLRPFGGQVPKGARVIAVPRGFAILGVATPASPARPNDGDHLLFHLVRDEPVISGDDVVGMRLLDAGQAGVHIRLRSDARRRLDRAIQAAGPRRSGLALDAGSGISIPLRSEDKATVPRREGDGIIIPGPGAGFLAPRLAAGGFSGGIGILRTENTGTPEPRSGETVEPLPRSVSAFVGEGIFYPPEVNPIVAGSALRVINSTDTGPHGAVWSFLTRDGTEVGMIEHEAGGRRAAGLCMREPASPLLSACATDGNSIAGRVHGDAREVIAVLSDGSRFSGPAKNGWFLIGSVPTKNVRELVALDGDGRRLASSDPREFLALFNAGGG